MLWDNRPDAEELKRIARGLHEGHIFTDRHIENGYHIELVFMPLALGGLAEVSKEEFEQVGMIYEWISAAGPRSVNGMPTFMSCRFLHKDDCEKVFKMYDALKKTTEETLDRIANE